MGLLIAEGSIDLSQFWPRGASDADTSQVAVRRFLFTAGDDPKHARPTNVFEHAMVHGRVVKKVLDERHRITVRYQGIDAPELHCQPVPVADHGDAEVAAKMAAFQALNHPYRQHYGETSALRLAEHLEDLAGGRASIECKVVTRVDHPNEVFDAYGRFVGNVVVGEDHDVNTWLVENGWAFPTFYSSMRPEEIGVLLEATKKGRRRGIWKGFLESVGGFDWGLIYSAGTGRLRAAMDAGKVILPKVFRRVVAYRANHRAKLFRGSFRSYLAAREPGEGCFETGDFLRNGISAAVPRRVYEMVQGSRFAVRPEGLVYQEAASKLVVAGRGALRW